MQDPVASPVLLPVDRLSAAARRAWAKHDRKTDSWLPLWRHMADSGAVAGLLWERWLPRSVRGLVSEILPGGEEDARVLVRFLAAVHDIGKATPAFACQVESLAGPMRDAGLGMPSLREYGEDRRLAPHGLAGQVLLQEWMDGRFGLRGRVSGQFAVVAGGHHGVPPDHGEIHDLQLRPRLLRHLGPAESLWRQVQYELMDACAEATGAASRLPAWGAVRLPQTVQVVLTAVVILADWIASAPELFPYNPQSWQPAGPVGERRRLRAAWDDLDLPEPWNPEEPEDSPADLFAHRFPGLADAAIRPVQSEAVEMARSMPEPGLLIVEAPMGEGKTEAALAAAEILAARSGAGGVLVALPTRATGDAMFPRLLRWLERLPAGLKEDRRRTVVLAHAKAALNEVWAGLLRRRQPSLLGVDADQRQGDTDVKPSALHAHQWLRGRKKQSLASFAVATVDQVLFAGLKSRHLALRHLAVAGKVVVIDEVHAYDAYMGRYLDRVLEWLAAYRVPVVLLSATLPQERRRALVAAYAGVEAAKEGETGSDAYPLITAACPGRPVLSARPPAASGRRTQVALERLDDDLEALADRLERELADEGCALVVRNTVDRVLQTATCCGSAWARTWSPWRTRVSSPRTGPRRTPGCCAGSVRTGGSVSRVTWSWPAKWQNRGGLVVPARAGMVPAGHATPPVSGCGPRACRRVPFPQTQPQPQTKRMPIRGAPHASGARPLAAHRAAPPPRLEALPAPDTDPASQPPQQVLDADARPGGG
ncbi:hypothetical protein GCM10010499_22250 [Streptomyces thermoviolaceus subsp. apingens]|nr:hypothetical protein GCM10010499_22250 [Streptomyces thermoviolaceus subsp. apingens]